MRVLALDTATRAGGVAIVDDAGEIFSSVGDGARSHAEWLPASIIDALAAANLASADIDVWAVASGPGSFTGLRIGIAAVQGFAVVHQRRVVPVSALLALAELARSARSRGATIGAWTDALRTDVFSALYHVLDAAPDAVGALEESQPAAVGRPQATWDRWSEQGRRPDLLIGDGALIYGTAVAPGVPAVAAPPLAPAIARLALVAARAGQTVSPAGIQPLYVRRPDVEVARDARGV